MIDKINHDLEQPYFTSLLLGIAKKAKNSVWQKPMLKNTLEISYGPQKRDDVDLKSLGSKVSFDDDPRIHQYNIEPRKSAETLENSEVFNEVLSRVKIVEKTQVEIVAALDRLMELLERKKVGVEKAIG